MSFAPGFTRAPQANRFTGDYDDTTPPLGAADGLLNARDPTQIRRAPTDRNLADVRAAPSPEHDAHRRATSAILQWLATQPAFATADTRFAEAARSGDLGYTWGTYSTAKRAGAGSARQAASTCGSGSAERNGQWKLALDVLQPQ